MTLGRNKWLQYVSVAMVIAAGVTASVIVFLTLHGVQQERIRAAFTVLAENRTAAFERDLSQHLEILSSIARLYASSREVDRGEFHAFVLPSLEQHSEITAVKWMPRVTDAERAEYENTARADGLADFRIHDRDAGGELVAAGQRAEYFPVYYVEPLEPNREVLGFDLGALADRQMTMASARDQGQPMATERVRLQQGDSGVLVFLPIYRNGAAMETVEQRRASLLGFAAMVFKVGTVFKKTLARERLAGTDIQMFDESAAPGNRLLHTHWSRQRATGQRELTISDLEVVERLGFAGRQWSLVFRPAPQFLAAHQSANAGIALTVGLLFTGVLGAFAFREVSRGIKLAAANAALRENQLVLERQSRLLEQTQTAAKIGGWELDLVTRQIFWTDGTYRIHEVSPAHYTPTLETAINFYVPESRPMITAAVEAAMMEGKEWDLELELITARQRRIWVRAVGEIQFAKGRPVKAYGAFQDITERKQAELRIRTQLEHLNLLDQITRLIRERQDLHSIFQVVIEKLEDSLPIDFGGVCLRDEPAHAFRFAVIGAKSVAQVQELTIGEQISIGVDGNNPGRRVQGQLVYEPDLHQVEFPFSQRLARSGLRSLVMVPLQIEDRVFGVLMAARRAAHSFSSAECEFLRQLSEHVALAAHQAQLYGALQEAYDDLRQTQQAVMQQERLHALGQMASGIAHDINNALSPVSLFTESLLETEQNLSERGRGHLQIIQRAVEDVAQTVARMREFSRPLEAQLMLVPVEVNRLVQQVVDLTHARWMDMPQQRGIVIQVQTDLAPDLPAIMGVESEIREVLTNLIFNAVDAMPEGGTLTMRTRFADVAKESERASIVIEIIDEGIGMDEDTRRHCLEPFFTTKGERGSGLGLAMVFGVVQRHGAEMEIESAPGAGTTVRLVFPVSAAVSAEPGKTAEAPAVPSRLRLLLIDDDPILLKSLREVLEGDGHEVTVAAGGQEGIDVFHASLGGSEPFGAVITDLGIPYVDGRRVAAAVKLASPDTPVILLTGWGQRLLADKDIPAHVDCVLAKPPKLHEVRATLARLCRRTSD